MADLLVRNIDAKLKRELEKRARTHGRSLSEEAKSILREGTVAEKPKKGLGTLLYEMVPDDVRGDDLVFEVPGTIGDPPDFK